MARGTPDGGISTYTYAGQSVDTSLIYQFLWGFSPVDGLGRPIYLDTFNNGLAGWRPRTAGAGIVPAVSGYLATPGPLTVFSPPLSAQCDPGIVANDESWIVREQFLGLNTRLGVEAAMLFMNLTPNYQMILAYNPIGKSALLGSIRFLRSGGTWQIFTPSGWVTIYTTGVPLTTSRMWIQVKLVADFDTGKYVRAFVGDNMIDISSYSISSDTTITNGEDGYLYADARCQSYGAGTIPGRFGYYLITKDEP